MTTRYVCLRAGEKPPEQDRTTTRREDPAVSLKDSSPSSRARRGDFCAAGHTSPAFQMPTAPVGLSQLPGDVQ